MGDDESSVGGPGDWPGRVGAVRGRLQNGFQPDRPRTTARDITAGK